MLLGTSKHIHLTQGGFTLPCILFHPFHFHNLLTGALYKYRYRYRCPLAKEIPIFFLLHHSCIGPTLSQTHRNYFLIRKNSESLSYRHTSISRYYHMYTKIPVQNSSISPEALQACLIAARAQFPLESSHFFLRSLLQSLTLNYQKSEQLYDAYILWNQYRPSFTQLTPVGDGDRPPCLVTSRADEYKRPTHAYTHTSRAAPNTQKY